ncbi:MAG: trypsin-like peptidase domain-containing protein [Clostridia bacterium]|nr:trypsin-like peptidase domain-containing protein [Clostridia bacterium]
MFLFGDEEKEEKNSEIGNAVTEKLNPSAQNGGEEPESGERPTDRRYASDFTNNGSERQEDGDRGDYSPPDAGNPYGGQSGYPYGGQGNYPYGGGQGNYPYGGGRESNPYGGGRGNSPYGGGGNYPYGGSGGGRKINGGLIALIVAIALIVGVGLIGLIIGSRSLFSADPSSRNVEERTVPTTTTGMGSEDGPSIDLAEAPEPVTRDSAPEGGEYGYSAAKVYDLIKDSSVGILVYDNESGELNSEGSGVIIGENDSHSRTYIVTCAHVISSMGISVKVMTSDDSTYDAQIVGYDKRTDLGVLMIKKTGLSSAQFAKTDGVRVGDTVYAIGNPGGSEFAGSFTNGMVSAIGRPVASSTSYTTKCIQHTAAINPGNSGGALVNAYGQVIGINSKKIVSTDYEGMGFAVPSDVVQEIANDLIKNGYIPNRAKLGISYLPASAYETYMMVVQLKEYPKGSIVIESITSDSNLRKEDVEKGDMIIAVNGKPLTDSDVLPNLMERAKPGDKLTLTIVRVSSSYTVKQFDVTVELIEDRGTVLDEEPEEETLFADDPETTDPFSYNPFD